MATVPLPVTSGEMIWRNANRLVSMNPLMMNSYYTTLFQVFRNMFMLFGDDENLTKMEKMIGEIEILLSDDLNPMTLNEAELRMFNNMDLLSGFEVNGRIVTQMEINERLEKVKTWLVGILYAYLPEVRFTTTFRVE